MQIEDIIYSRAKERLKNYSRTVKKNINEKVIYECAVIQYMIRQDYRDDTRLYSISLGLYEEEREKVMKLCKKINKNEEHYEKALDACKDALDYMELVMRPRVNMEY
ncbi:hypothetical protein GCM10023142_07570 [Anaerocolumna aminovalerica]|jgi:hypothetical protein|uniref:Uncharacterized protein n=1 Tax=Anaerocolumna aminovalerica TaxID=1527 RepID=A0A1I5J586_9FIRM|nr:hypothetical protein [Anaerocolumna aminovalerica]MBU5332733.1 hypothetical protein [Anaerocolumna aminovalerica]MDU6264873.1 hypothetical protein [Anaerocolumna aminovalerica]SFO67541.1 hypothetical protein SAMN04489757_1664 [Anaerocolumna aminovalerica]